MTSKTIGTVEPANHRHARFLSALTHELRTPLGSVLMLAEMMADTGGTSGRLEHLASKIREATLDMRDLIDQVARMARIESGRVPINLEVVTVDSLADQISRVLHEHADADHACEVRVAEGTPTRLRTDRKRVSEIVFCLVGDLVSDEEVPVATVIRPTASADGTTGIAIDVRHPSATVTADQLESLFEPFRHAFRQTGRRHGGQSLRLTIAEALSRQLNGTLNAFLDDEVGLTLQLELPAAPNAPDDDS